MPPPLETPSSGQPTTWKPHIGDSFVDTPRTSGRTRFIETLLHNGVTTGIDPAKMALRPGRTVLRGTRWRSSSPAPWRGAMPSVPTAGTVTGKGPYDCRVRWCLALQRRRPHRLVLPARPPAPGAGHHHGVRPRQRPVCPTPPVTRGPMAVFIARAVAGSEAGVPLATPTRAPAERYSLRSALAEHVLRRTSRSGDWYCKHVHYLWATGVISGCDQTNHLYCPGSRRAPGSDGEVPLPDGFGLKLHDYLPPRGSGRRQEKRAR